MNYELIADRTRYLKENPKGVTDMCKSMEDMRDRAWNEGRAEGKAEGIAVGKAEGIAEGSIKTLMALVRDGILTLVQAAERSGLSEAEFAEKIMQIG